MRTFLLDGSQMRKKINGKTGGVRVLAMENKL